MESKYGTLYVVATPIGNLADLSERAIRILAAVDLVAAEDTRSAARLFQYAKITPTRRSYHDHNKEAVTPEIIGMLAEGRDVALISEAGTPAVSDPGFYLVRAAHRLGIPVRVVPGPCAAVAALSISGIPTDQFYFAGFLPRGKKKRPYLEEALLLNVTVVFYESPKRILKTLSALHELIPDRLICLTRELTKIYEESRIDDAGRLYDYYKKRPEECRGEFTLIIAPEGYRIDEDHDVKTTQVSCSPLADAIDEIMVRQVDLLVEAGYRPSEAVRIVARGHDVPKNALYQAHLADPTST